MCIYCKCKAFYFEFNFFLLYFQLCRQQSTLPFDGFIFHETQIVCIIFIAVKHIVFHCTLLLLCVCVCVSAFSIVCSGYGSEAVCGAQVATAMAINPSPRPKTI